MMSTTITNHNRFHPLKFALWLGIASMIMLFAALTSAYIIRKAQGNWVDFRMPAIFWFDTVVIIISSITMQWTVRAFRRFQVNACKIALTITLLLGIIFLIGQYRGWSAMEEMGIYINGNPSGSFVYVISGVHAAHIVGGLVIMLSLLLKMVTSTFNPNRLVRVELMSTYWHFVDVLWIYLFIFFQINIF
ncbi:MAG: cytochrome c oxidase subunit 3 [Chitinophagales bacterium]|jgi:cytochrome c oxidase subunit 3|nr:cytochrome c oxidase subunit 3 [Chitinophagales bacterium]